MLLLYPEVNQALCILPDVLNNLICDYARQYDFLEEYKNILLIEQDDFWLKWISYLSQGNWVHHFYGIESGPVNPQLHESLILFYNTKRKRFVDSSFSRPVPRFNYAYGHHALLDNAERFCKFMHPPLVRKNIVW